MVNLSEYRTFSTLGFSTLGFRTRGKRIRLVVASHRAQKADVFVDHVTADRVFLGSPAEHGVRVLEVGRGRLEITLGEVDIGEQQVAESEVRVVRLQRFRQTVFRD